MQATAVKTSHRTRPVHRSSEANNYEIRRRCSEAGARDETFLSLLVDVVVVVEEPIDHPCARAAASAAGLASATGGKPLDVDRRQAAGCGGSRAETTEEMHRGLAPSPAALSRGFKRNQTENWEADVRSTARIRCRRRT